MNDGEHYAPEDDVPDDWRPADTRRWSKVELLAEIDALNMEVAKWVGIATERRGGVALGDAAVERATDALLADSGLPRFGPHRATIERRVRLAFDAVRDDRA